MPLMLQLPGCPDRIPIRPEGTFVGRQELRACAERMFVSRHHCKLILQANGQQALLLHTGGGNPTLVIRANERQVLKPDPLHQEDRVLLSVGDAFSVLATKPEEAFLLVWQDGEEQQPGNDSQQQQQQQQEGAVDQAVLQAATQELPQQQQQRQQRQQQQHTPTSQPAARPEAPAGSTPAAAAAAAAAAVPSGVVAAAPAAAAASAAAPAVMAAPPGSPVMLILAGLPGSGKSTFAAALAAGSSRAWVRINQDSIRGGGGSSGSSGEAKPKSGTRKQCVNAAAAALSAGKNAIIDRCNLDADQRTDFCRLGARLGVPVHLLQLSLETRLCVTRAAGRRDHEGGVQGKGAARIVHAMAAQAKKAAPPSAAEGLATITNCTSDAQVAAALRRWTAATAGLPKPAREQQQQQGVSQASPQAAAAAAAQEGRDSPPKKRQRTNSPKAAPQQQQQQEGSSSPAAAAAAAAAAARSSGTASSSKNAFSMLMSAAKQQQKSRAAGGSTPPTTKSQQPKAAAASAPAAAAGARGLGGWSGELSHVAAEPDRFRSVQAIWHVDDLAVGLRDKYPKARHHGLLLAREPGLNRASQLTPQHLPLLRHMRHVALGWMQEQQQGQQGQQQQKGQAAPAAASGAAEAAAVPEGWQVGFHSVPSMAQLHLHIISRDFNSESLKTKKHWNSFTSAFFLHLDDVIRQLEASGRISVDVAAAEQLLKQPMRCHMCDQELANIPQLKQHLRAACTAHHS